MSLSLALSIMGLNFRQFENVGRLLDLSPTSIAELLFNNEILMDGEDYNKKLAHNPDEIVDLNKVLQLQYQNVKMKINYDKRDLMNLNRNIRETDKKWTTASFDEPKWKNVYNCPLRSHPSSVFHILGGNEYIIKMPGDDEGFGVPVPYTFSDDVDSSKCAFCNAFGDIHGYNYNTPENPTEIVDQIRLSALHLIGERQSLAMAEEMYRDPVVLFRDENADPEPAEASPRQKQIATGGNNVNPRDIRRSVSQVGRYLTIEIPSPDDEIDLNVSVNTEDDEVPTDSDCDSDSYYDDDDDQYERSADEEEEVDAGGESDAEVKEENWDEEEDDDNNAYYYNYYDNYVENEEDEEDIKVDEEIQVDSDSEGGAPSEISETTESTEERGNESEGSTESRATSDSTRSVYEKYQVEGQVDEIVEGVRLVSLSNKKRGILNRDDGESTASDYYELDSCSDVSASTDNTTSRSAEPNSSESD